MKTYEIRCDRCNRGPLEYDYHDGIIAMSSPRNQREIFGDDAETHDIAFCDPCYKEWHQGMKAWMRGKTISVR